MVTHMSRNSKGLNDAISRRRAGCGRAPLVIELQRYPLDQLVSPSFDPVDESGARALMPRVREHAGQLVCHTAR
jgi:hypothetical protein